MIVYDSYHQFFLCVDKMFQLNFLGTNFTIYLCMSRFIVVELKNGCKYVARFVKSGVIGNYDYKY